MTEDRIGVAALGIVFGCGLIILWLLWGWGRTYTVTDRDRQENRWMATILSVFSMMIAAFIGLLWYAS